MKKAIDVKINIRPVYSNLVHTDIWEGPCRVGPAELLDPTYEKRAGLEQAMDAIRQKAEKLGLSDSVSFMGSVANVHEWYQAFDAFVLPSIWEGLPVVGVEAQAADLPCVFSGSVTSEIGMLDKTRFVGLEESPEVWADAVQAALANEGRGDVRSIIAAHGYDIAVEAKKLQERYLKMAGEQE